MKKIIITTTIVLAASFAFYVHEGITLLSPVTVSSYNNVSYESLANLGLKDTQKLDIGQVDIN